MNINKHSIALILGLAAAATGLQANAGQLSATRLIFAGGAKDASITYTNTSDRCIGLYVWTATQPASDPTTARSPLALLQPPKMVVGAGQSQSLRLRLLDNTAATSESMYWLSTHEVAVDPALCTRSAREDGDTMAGTLADATDVDSAMKASLEVAVRTHIKILVRPKSLPIAYKVAAKQLQWSVQQQAGKSYLVATNPTGYHVHFSSLAVKSSGRSVEPGGRKGGTILPNAQTRFEMTQAISATGQVSAQLINDQGGTFAHDWSL